MKRVFAKAFATTLLLANLTAASGLQSALTTSLAGLQDAVLTINGGLVNSREQALQAAIDRVQGGIFIDPVASTLGEGVFGPGPRFSYDSATGGLAIDAPPLLGPADEFGLRRQYSPTSLSIVAGGNLAAAVSVPELSRLVRNEPPRFIDFNNPPAPRTPESPAFLPVENATPSFSVSGSTVSVPRGFLFIRGLGDGLESLSVSFDQVLAPGLDASAFTIGDELITPDGIGVLPDSFFSTHPDGLLLEGLPEVYVDVTYSLVNRPAGVTRFPTELSLLALPTAVPEPSTAVILGLGSCVAAMLLPRRFAPRVA